MRLRNSADRNEGTRLSRVPQPVEGKPQVRAANATGLQTQASRFIISGGISAVFDYGLTTILQSGFGFAPTPARAGGVLLGTAVAYLINRRWTFQAAPSARRFLAVVVLYLLTFFLNIGLYKVAFHLLESWGASEWIAITAAFVFAQGITTVVNFLVQRIFIFKVR